MSIFKKLAVAGTAVLIVGTTAFADVEVTPYGAAQYRLRFQHNQAMPDEGDGFGSFDYNNQLAWRLGTRVKLDDQLSLQFQFGNDWGASEGVNWNSNHSPFGRVGTHNFYAHLAYARWNPGFMFIEAGIIPLNSNGTLDLLANSLGGGRYANAGWNAWSDANSSIIGLKIGVPVVEGVGVELTQAVIDNRSQSLAVDAPGNPTSIMLDLQVPISAGAFKVTPEFTMVLNRNFNNSPEVEAGDHEILFGLAGSFKASDMLSLNFNFGMGMVSNENSRVGAYGSNVRSGNAAPDDEGYTAVYSSQGILAGIGATLRDVGPGNIQLALNYNSSENTELDDNNFGQLYTDVRYAIKLHKNFVFTPRWRTYTYLVPDNTTGLSSGDIAARPNGVRLNNRVELILEGSF